MGVKWLKAALMVAFIGVFAVATNHCRLEVLKGLEFLICCSHDADTDHEAAPHQDDDCDTDGCATLEQGLYKSEDGRVASITPALSLLACTLSTPEGHPFASTLNTVAPPELSVSWQFTLRAALSPRAPSLVS